MTFWIRSNIKSTSLNVGSGAAETSDTTEMLGCRGVCVVCMVDDDDGGGGGGGGVWDRIIEDACKGATAKGVW
eukprot:CAMPEP_0175047242 /NCGR_PEP_ID=MMETSP0052_2-20121109/5479_1 /TAXON_ID=51329 ORGANISM="Polytomella parva, Strain SAG 63-3" /NCGR_SAMPLE_ID=MMETSP0052_2 /ASSEMBLY_ACC=CAM_ASM_000194 /LENGTH=72 /DNA_ID=CAMNT_0016311081 /DNA_START=510 /DNA_END=725 /DNA_ORIENTATION=+